MREAGDNTGPDTTGLGTIRSCFACRQKQEKRELIRFVKSKAEPERWRVDAAALLPGRGLYCHPEARCIRSPKLERALGSAFGEKNGRAEALLREALSQEENRRGNPERQETGEHEKLGRNAFSFRRNEKIRGTAALREMMNAVFPAFKAGPGKSQSVAPSSNKPEAGNLRKSSSSAGKRIRL